LKGPDNCQHMYAKWFMSRCRRKNISFDLPMSDALRSCTPHQNAPRSSDGLRRISGNGRCLPSQAMPNCSGSRDQCVITSRPDQIVTTRARRVGDRCCETRVSDTRRVHRIDPWRECMIKSACASASRNAAARRAELVAYAFGTPASNALGSGGKPTLSIANARR